MKLTTGKTKKAQVTLTMSVAEAALLLEMASAMARQEAQKASGLYRESLISNEAEWSEVAESLRHIES